VSTVTAPAILTTTMSTPIGALTILAVDGLVHAGGFTEDVRELTRRLAPGLREAPIEQARDLGPISERLAAYFEGEVVALDELDVIQPGGPFQQRVWAALRQIRPGQQITYRDLARRLGGANLARAVGMGCATNLISPIVPCHRLTRTGGNLAGYYWGLDRKRWLLDHERHHAIQPCRGLKSTPTIVPSLRDSRGQGVA
jgi:methylated-DNA-[protein]-cysteine S-methyltransferase